MKFKTLIIAALATASLLAHDMWLESDAFRVKPGTEVTIAAGNGSIFKKSENAVSPSRIATLVVLGPDGQKVETGAPGEDGSWLKFSFTTAQEGNYLVGLASKPRPIQLSGKDFNNYLEHDGLPHVLEERKKKGILDRDETEVYSKYVKTYIQAGERTSDNYKQPLGLKIEIVPLENPYVLEAGDELPVQALFDGQPLEGLLLHAASAGATENVHIYTDADGRAYIPLESSGKWYIRAIHLTQVDLPDHSYESYWASLTFEVG